jgi:small-conductance mechanosensitive channel
MNDIFKSVFTRIPTITELIITGAILLGSYIAGIIFKKVFLKWLIKITEKTTWKGDDLIIDASKNILVNFFLLVGVYFVSILLPFTGRIQVLLIQIIQVIAIILTTLVVSRIIVGWINLYQEQTEGRIPSTSILQYVAKTIIFIIGGLFILQSLGISVTPLLTALGVGGLAVALALQDTLSNLFAGLQILAAKNMHPGDYIMLETGDEGYITDINWRSTTIKALPNRIIIIPNNKLASSVVKNFSMPDKEIAVLVDVGVSYTSDLEKVENITIDVAREVMKNVPEAVTDFEPFIRYNKLDAYFINFSVILRAQEFSGQYLIKHEFIKKLHKRYKEEGIQIPYPITTVYMHQKAETNSE